MANAVKRIGVLTSGGDAPGMNAAIRSVVRACTYMGIECVGIRRGYNGLINGDFTVLKNDNVAHIINRGGTMLYTARSDEFRTLEGQKKAAATCKLLGLDGIVSIGGDGSFRGLVELAKQGVSVVGVPATIDNDIVCTDYTIGYDTAMNTALEMIDKLRDTTQSHDRCSVVEVMGRNAGYIALNVAIASGAMAVLLPWVRRSSVLREFGNSPTLTQPFTLRLEEQALQVWSKFEQYTLPWQGITYAKETKDYIILIGCYRMGLFVIEKANCDPADLNALLSALHEKAPAFGGAK